MAGSRRYKYQTSSGSVSSVAGRIQQGQTTLCLSSRRAIPTTSRRITPVVSVLSAHTCLRVYACEQISTCLRLQVAGRVGLVYAVALTSVSRTGGTSALQENHHAVSECVPSRIVETVCCRHVTMSGSQ